MKRGILLALALVQTCMAFAQLSVSLDQKADCIDENKSKIWATATGGTPPYEYSWDGTTYGPDDTLYVPIADFYTVQVRDALGQIVSDNISAGGLLSLSFMNPEVRRFRPNCASNSCVMAFPNDTFPNGPSPGYASGPFTYEWSTGPDDTLALNCNTDPFVTTYSVTITSSEGCTLALTGNNITYLYGMEILPVVTQPNCGSYGSVTANSLGGLGPHTVSWRDYWFTLIATGVTLDSVSPIQSLTILVTDDEGCWVEEIIDVDLDTTVNYPLPASPDVVIDTCALTACMEMNVAGMDTALLGYQWQTADGVYLPDTTHVACIDSSGTYLSTIYSSIDFRCYNVDTVEVILPSFFSVTPITTAATCTNDGSVTVTISGGQAPYTFLWSNGATTDTIKNLLPGNYSVTVTDASGCSGAAHTVVQEDRIRFYSAATRSATCSTSPNGWASITATGLHQPFTYLWSNGATDSLAVNLLPGTYSVTVTDTNGCTISHNYTVPGFALSVPIQMHTPVSCVTESGGIAKVLPNGTAPYSYQWSNGSTADTAANLIADTYNVTVTDNYGCTGVNSIAMNYDPSCLALVRGMVYFDKDSSCSINAGDVGINNKMVVISPGYAAYTDATGFWQATVKNAASYQVYVTSQGTPADDICGIDTLNINVPNTVTVSNINFPKLAPRVNDVSISFNCGQPRPGFNHLVHVRIDNNSLNSANVRGSFVLDAAISNIVAVTPSSPIIIDSISVSLPRTVYFKANGLPAQSSKTFVIEVRVPALPLVSLGQTLTHSGAVTFLNFADVYLDNNSDTCNTIIMGAYDPNDKQVFSETGENIDGPTTATDTLLRYLVRFQNTGNDTAFRVVVRDTLHSNLDIHTFQLIATSHPVEVAFMQDSIIHFTFNNILLPDSNVNEPRSHGFVEFEIQVEDASLLDELTNRAAIYFDYNPPIYTNTVATQRHYYPCLHPANNLTTTTSQTICYGDSYWGYSASGTYTDTFTLNAGCDSISILNLTVLPQNLVTRSQTICHGQAFEGHTATGVYADTLVGSGGCDSISVLNLTVSNAITSTLNQSICHGDSYLGYTETGIYINTLTSATGCDSVRQLNLTVAQQLTTNLPEVICEGDSIFAAGAYQTIAGNYTDTLTAIGGCDSLVVTNLTVNPAPPVPTIQQNGAALSASGTGAAIYTWYINDNIIPNETGATLNLTQNGVYHVAVTDSAGCSSTSTKLEVTGVAVTEIGQVAVMVFPNPTTGWLSVSLGGLMVEQVELYDLMGRIVLSQNYQPTAQADIDASGLSNGLYMVRIRSGAMWYMDRVVKVE